MNVNIVPPVTLNLSSAKLMEEDGSTGTIWFKVEEQPCMIVLTYGRYSYISTMMPGDRVRIKKAYGMFGINSEGLLNQIIIDSTDDKADVIFDKMYPNSVFSADVVEANSGDIAVLFRVPLSYLEKI